MNELKDLLYNLDNDIFIKYNTENQSQMQKNYFYKRIT